MHVATKSRILWLSEDGPPENVRSALEPDWELAPADASSPLSGQLDGAALVAIRPDGRADDPRWLDSVLDELRRTDAVGVFLLPPASRVAWGMLTGRGGNHLCVSDEAPREELAASLHAAAALQPAIRELQTELAASRAIASGGEDIDEELRLAARLQRDFLPHHLPEVGRVRFDVLFRPAGWVSGDIYDVTRLDETHVGFYVADAIGHGMPAALLTMFIKKALQMKRIAGHTYELVPPTDALAGLNADICEQDLSSCQFCTAVYCTVSVPDLTVQYARAGHPEPIILRAAGGTDVLTEGGCLLGVFPDEAFPGGRVQLRRGDRMLLYSDGLEEVLGRGEDGHVARAIDILPDYRGVNRQAMLSDISERIDRARRDHGPCDDISIVVLDVE